MGPARQQTPPAATPAGSGRLTRKTAQAHLERRLAALEHLSLAQLQAEWAALGDGPPPSLPAPLLCRLLAQLIQEHAIGGFPAHLLRELDRLGSDGPPDPPAPRKATLSVGTRLVREWNGQTISVDVTAEGFVWGERTYGSLSEIAGLVTGTKWSGPRFFGVNRRG